MIAEQHLARYRLCLAGEPLALSKNIKLYLREEEKDPSKTANQVDRESSRIMEIGLSVKKQSTHHFAPLLQVTELMLPIFTLHLY